MKKNWNNPQLNQLETKFTEEEFGVLSFSQDSNGADAQAYTEAEAATIDNSKMFFPLITWYFYDCCAKQWVSTGKCSLCEAINYAFDYMRKHYPNGCKVSNS